MEQDRGALLSDPTRQTKTQICYYATIHLPKSTRTMFRISQQGLIGFQTISSLMYTTEDQELPKDGGQPQLPLKDDTLSEVASDMADDDLDLAAVEDAHNQSLRDIPFEDEHDFWRNNSHTEMYDGHDHDHDIPYEQNVQVMPSWTRAKDGERHQQFHIESLGEIPFEDGRKVRVNPSYLDSADSLNGIPYEHDTVTTFTEELSSHADQSTMVDIEEEEKDDIIASLLDDMEIVEEEQDCDDDSIEALFEKLNHDEESSIQEETPEMNETMTPTSGKHWQQTEDIEMSTEEHNETTFKDKELNYSLGFTVKVEIRPTPHLGENQFGVFALQDIPFGHLIWYFTNILETFHHDELEGYIERNYAEDDLEGIREFLRRGLPLKVPNSQHFVSAVDGCFGFLNHSAAPNIHARRAARKICKGEELTIDYAFYGNPQWYADICHKYGILSAAEIAKRQEKLGTDRFMPADYFGEDELERNDVWLSHYVQHLEAKRRQG
jgi:hypothetical protein